MKNSIRLLTIILSIMLGLIFSTCQSAQKKNPISKDDRMAWWREARFGMFIHWGLYAIPAGEWNGKKNYAEWIRTNAQIPLEEYDQLIHKFNPEKFNAEAWVQNAKDAGMKYIVITSKHHDGFCLFDSKYTDFDVMSTPFNRDIMRELSAAANKADLKMCWYHSIMDWHHPDYLPRRNWETNRSSEGANFDRYIHYMKSQLKELVTNYGEIDVLWFDGEWESTWTHEYGKDLYKYVQGLQPNIIINNRVDVNRGGMAGISTDDQNVGDFGTPEQQIPATGMPDLDWETCMTMNDHWGYNKFNDNWKSTEQLLQMLADIASKGGNFLLNVGPTAEGVFPQESIDRLREMGEWMKINGESIYGTQASPFKNLEWGRCTQKSVDGGTRLYLHVFDWPIDGKLIVPGIFNKAYKAYSLADSKKELLEVNRDEDALEINVRKQQIDEVNSVIVLDIEGKPDIANPPNIKAEFDTFIDELDINITSDRENIIIRYTLDGSEPTIESKEFVNPVKIISSTAITARCFRNEKAVSRSVDKSFKKVEPQASVSETNLDSGLLYAYYEGEWDVLPDFSKLTTKKEGVTLNFDIESRIEEEYFGFEYRGYILIPKTGMYAFYTVSDDGSQLFIDEQMVVDNDGLHGAEEKEGACALAEGLHSIRVTFFEKTGGNELKVFYRGRGIKKQSIPAGILFHGN